MHRTHGTAQNLTRTSRLYNEYEYSNKKWSRELLKAFPPAPDKTLKYQYVIKRDSTFNIEDIYNSILSWYKVKMPQSVTDTQGSPERVSTIGILQHVGKARVQ